LAKPHGGGRKRVCWVFNKKSRYVTVTGQPLDGSPTTIENRQHHLEEIHRNIFQAKTPKAVQAKPPGATLDLDDSEVIRRATEAKNGGKFRRLWDGDTSGHRSKSEADLALCNYLRFWCGRNADRIDELFRQSGLFRSKWNRDNFRERTLSLAMEGEVYDPSHGKHTSNGKDQQAKAAPQEWPGDPIPLDELRAVPLFPVEVLSPWLACWV